MDSRCLLRDWGEGRAVKMKGHNEELVSDCFAYLNETLGAAPTPDEVRSELDEFEAAVERAQRDSAATAAPGTRINDAGFSEGAEQ